MPNPQLKLPFGKHRISERLIGIDEIRREQTGAACECVCPSCAQPLWARLPVGDSAYTANFAHAPDQPCPHPPETVLHKTAKLLVAQERRVVVPSSKSKPARSVEFAEGFCERPTDDNAIVPDATLVWRGAADPAFSLFVEIVVAHAPPQEKIEYIAQRKLRAVRVDLDHLDRDCSPAALRAALFDPATARVAWIALAPPPSPRSISPEPARVAGLYVGRETPPPKCYPEKFGPVLVRPVVWGERQNRRVATRMVPSCPLRLRSEGGRSFADADLDCMHCTACLFAPLHGAQPRVLCFAESEASSGPALEVHPVDYRLLHTYHQEARMYARYHARGKVWQPPVPF